MLLAVKTVKSDWCVSIRLLLVKKSVGLLLVKCLLFVCFVVIVNKSVFIPHRAFQLGLAWLF